MNKKNGFKWSYVILALLLVFCLVLLFSSNGNIGDQITVDQAYEKLSNNEITNVYAYDGMVKIRKVGSEIEATDFPLNSDYYFSSTDSVIESFIDAVIEHNALPTTTTQISWDYPPVQMNLWDIIMPILYIGFGLLLIILIFKMFNNANKGAMNFGKSKARAIDNVKVRFSDIAGADEEKTELQEIVEFLKNPEKFTNLGAKIPKGILIVGPPGTGKTLLARAVAGESNVPFLSISGSDFVEMYVGVGASRVRDLFLTAKKSSPCIIFIDEIDAVGRQRGAGLGGGNDEREQTLNQLLVEMDGFEANEGIIVLAATNRSDVLDPALLRPGRFDRQIYVNVPDVRGREGIMKIHARNKPIDDEVNFQNLARLTSGFTGADIENMLNEAAILAARANRPKIIMEDILEGINKVIMGPQKKSRIVTERDKKITAYHESGHAIIGKKLPNCEQVQEVSIIPRGMAAGYTMSRPENDDNHVTYNKLNDTIAMIMGGRIAEEIIFKDISTGASNDIERATEIARKMVVEWGMSKKLGFINFKSQGEVFIGRDYQTKVQYSEQTAAEIDQEIQGILQSNYARAKKILIDNKELLEKMSELLLEKETIFSEEVDMLMQGKTKEEILERMASEEKRKKLKQEQGKIDFELQQRIKQLEQKVRTGEMYFKNGIISQKDYECLVAEKNRLVEELTTKAKEHQIKTAKTEKTKTTKAVKTEKVDKTKETADKIATSDKKETKKKPKTNKTNDTKEKEVESKGDKK